MYKLKNFKVIAVLTFKIDSFFVCVVGRTQEWRPSLMLTEFKTRPLPCIFCLVAHKSKIVCQAEMSGSWQDAPVTFQLERASVLQPSGQISNNRSSRKEPSSNHKEVSGNLLDKLFGCFVAWQSDVLLGIARQTVLYCLQKIRHWHWLLFNP